MTLMSRRAVAHEVLNSERFQAELAVIAKQADKQLTEARKEAYVALRALASVQIPFFGFLYDRGLGPLHARAWSLDVDWAALKRLQKENANKALVFLPTHRSYADPYILTKILQSIRMPRNYVLGGDNLGTVGRRTGAIFIRRSFGDDEVYKLAVREYMRYLVASGANIEWYMQKRLRNPECVSRELFTNALALAANRGLRRSGADDLADKRRAFAEETATAVSDVAAIGELDYRLRHSSRDLH
jgi:glycerol-3-phosphate O-acyltransferase